MFEETNKRICYEKDIKTESNLFRMYSILGTKINIFHQKERIKIY
jgi:hypothetical protein